MQQVRRLAVSTMVLIWAGLDAHAALAQNRPIKPGDEVQSRLDESDPRTSGSVPVVHDDYLIQMAPGQRLEAELSSTDFDAYLALYRQGETGGEPLAFNDDVAPGTDSRLRFTADRAGTYVLRARPFVGTIGGDYRLTVREQLATAYPSPRPLAPGMEQQGQLSQASARDEDEEHFDLFVLRGQAGERVALTLESDDFDPRLTLGHMNDGFFEELADNDDAPGRGLNAYLVSTLPETGEVLVKVRSVGELGKGQYLLLVEEGPKAPQTRALAMGETVSGQLTGRSGIGQHGVPADHYRFVGKAGDRVIVTLESEDFDALVEIFDADMVSLGQDDDSGGELNARLVQVLPADGTYVIEARSVVEGNGRYELAVEAVAPPPPPARLVPGQSVEGELTEDAAVDDSGRRYVAYTLEGQKDQRIQLTLRSGDFDAVTEIGMAGEAFTALANDDDGLRQGTDSRLVFSLPQDGRYELRALGYDSSAKGLYAIDLVDLGPAPEPGSLLIPSVVRASLTELDRQTDEGMAYDTYVFKAKAEEKLRFTLVSPSFDAVVEVGEDSEDRWRRLASDDDSLSDTHARLDWTAPRDGTYQVRAQGYRAGDLGSYVLMVERQP